MTEKPNIAEVAGHFTEMASRISGNQENDFGGAFVIISPDGKVTNGLFLTAPDIPMFWSVIKAKMEIAVAEAAQAEQQNPFGMRR